MPTKLSIDTLTRRTLSKSYAIIVSTTLARRARSPIKRSKKSGWCPILLLPTSPYLSSPRLLAPLQPSSTARPGSFMLTDGTDHRLYIGSLEQALRMPYGSRNEKRAFRSQPEQGGGGGGHGGDVGGGDKAGYDPRSGFYSRRSGTQSAIIESAPWPPPYVLSTVAGDTGLIIVTSVNCGYLDMAANFLLSVRRTSDVKVRGVGGFALDGR